MEEKAGHPGVGANGRKRPWRTMSGRRNMTHSFTAAGGVLKFVLPEDWRDASDEVAVSFSSPSGTAALTVSVYKNSEVDASAVELINASTQPFGSARSEKRPLTVPQGTGFARDFTKMHGDSEIWWLAHFLFRPDVTIIGSVNAPPAEMITHRDAFENLLASIAFEKTPSPRSEICHPLDDKFPGA